VQTEYHEVFGRHRKTPQSEVFFVEGGYLWVFFLNYFVQESPLGKEEIGLCIQKVYS
jgi:hypothetical protein